MLQTVLGFNQEEVMKKHLEIEELVMIDYIDKCFGSDDHDKVMFSEYEWVEIKDEDFLKELPLLFEGRPDCRLDSSKVSKAKHYLAVLFCNGCVEMLEMSEPTDCTITHTYYRLTEKAPSRR